MNGLIIALFLLLLPATGFVVWLRMQPTTNNRPLATDHRRQLVTTIAPPKRTIDYAAERQLIRLALAGGMAPGAVAGLLRGSPQARRRRVLKVAREVQRVAVAPQKLEAATI